MRTGGLSPRGMGVSASGVGRSGVAMGTRFLRAGAAGVRLVLAVFVAAEFAAGIYRPTIIPGDGKLTSKVWNTKKICVDLTIKRCAG